MSKPPVIEVEVVEEEDPADTEDVSAAASAPAAPTFGAFGGFAFGAPAPAPVPAFAEVPAAPPWVELPALPPELVPPCSPSPFVELPQAGAPKHARSPSTEYCLAHPRCRVALMGGCSAVARRMSRGLRLRLAPTQGTVGLGVNFKVIRGGTGALRHTGHRGGLGRMPRATSRPPPSSSPSSLAWHPVRGCRAFPRPSFLGSLMCFPIRLIACVWGALP